MNGAQALMSSAAAMGVDVCFANPGTTELAMIDALDKTPTIRPILSLFEGVCTGAADGYGRMLGHPAMTVLHLGPGFANGIANLHNARRAHTPILNLIGDHATWHVEYDPPLASDIASLAKPVSAWFDYARSADECGLKIDDAVSACLTADGQIATLVVPTDAQETETVNPARVPAKKSRLRGDYSGAKVEQLAKRLSDLNGEVVFLLGTKALTEIGQNAAAQISSKISAKIYAETFPARWERGAHIAVPQRFPYFPEIGIDALKNAAIVVIVGAKAPAAYFGTTGLPSMLSPEGSVFELASPEDDAEAAIAALAEELGVSNEATSSGWEAPSAPNLQSALDVQTCGEVVAFLLPEYAIAMVEGATSTPPFYTASPGGAAHTLITNTGGAIGQGMPVATGAAIACPDRQVINLQADGSGAYTVQALWTQAREQLNVVTVLCSNRKYGILRVEFERAGIDPKANITDRMTSLDNPPLDWVAIANGFGVPANKANTVEELQNSLSRALAEPGPYLIEVPL
jgi:acetolactate synthase-1/2/3 large subunit